MANTEEYYSASRCIDLLHHSVCLQCSIAELSGRRRRATKRRWIQWRVEKNGLFLLYS